MVPPPGDRDSRSGRITNWRAKPSRTSHEEDPWEMEREKITIRSMISHLPGDLILVMATLSVVLYGGLPATVPMHFDRSGLPDATLPRWAASVLLPVLGLIVLWIPDEVDRFSPTGLELLRDRAAIDGMVTCVLVFLGTVHALLLANALGLPLPLHRLIPVAVGLMVGGMGLFLPALPRNVWLGITMPWTLASPENWQRSHACAGAIWSLGGVLLALTGVWVPEIAEVWIAGLAALILSSVLVSYLVSS